MDLVSKWPETARNQGLNVSIGRLAQYSSLITEPMLRVGLTGSIGVGKSFVASVLTELGCRAVDANEHLARRWLNPVQKP